MMPFINQVAESTANLEIRVSPEVQLAGWQQSLRQRNGLARHQYYLNYVTLHTFFDWLTHWLDSSQLPALWPSETALAEIWTLTTGSAIQIGDLKVVVVPIEDLERAQLSVPQEWVDSPEWAADYYIGCCLQVDEADDDDWLEIHGFTTHQQLKVDGVYDRPSQTYRLRIEQLFEDLDALQLTLGATVSAEVPPLLSLSEQDAQRCIELLGQGDIFSPRLHPQVTFEQWACLLANDAWRYQLYQQRIQPARMASSTVIAQDRVTQSQDVQEQPTQSQTTVVSSTFNLGEWLQNQFEPVWQGVESLLDPQQQNQVYAFMADEQPTVRRARLIDLEMQLQGQAVTLLVALVPEVGADEKVEVRVQLFPAGGTEHLPAGIRLGLLAQSGRAIAEVVARDRDYCIQLNPFKYRVGRQFRLRLSLGESTIITDDVYRV